MVMSKEKQIEEMADIICSTCIVNDGHCGFRNRSKRCPTVLNDAETLYNEGYRKQSEGEWLEQVRVSKEGKPLLRHYKCNLCGVYLATQANFCPNCGAKMKGE